jgi:hypothetical protein
MSKSIPLSNHLPDVVLRVLVRPDGRQIAKNCRLYALLP